MVMRKVRAQRGRGRGSVVVEVGNPPSEGPAGADEGIPRKPMRDALAPNPVLLRRESKSSGRDAKEVGRTRRDGQRVGTPEEGHVAQAERGVVGFDRVLAGPE